MTPILFVLGTALAQDAPEPASTAGQDTDLDRAMELFQNGKTLFDEGNYEAAISAWQKAYDLSDRPTLLYNIASAAERLGDYDRALASLNAYRAFAKADEREALERRMRNLEGQRDAAEAAREAEAVAPSPSGPAATTVPDAPREKKRGGGQRIAGGALIGLGAVGIGTGIALGVLSNGRKNDGAKSCLDSGLCLADAREPLDASRSLGLAADVSLLAGIVSAGVGTVLVVTAPTGSVRVGLNSVRFDGRF